MIMPRRRPAPEPSAAPAEAGRTVALIGKDPADVRLLQDALAKEDPTTRVEVLTDGEAALAYLSGDRGGRPVPTAIVCDLDLTGMSGFALLAWLQSRPEFAAIPVFVVTTSRQPQDLQRAYALGAKSYLVRPISGAGLASLVQAVAGRREPPEPRLKQIVVGSSSENPDIHARRQYRVRIGKDWYEGAFSKRWFGWCFDDFGESGMQLNLIDEVFEIQGSGPSFRRMRPRSDDRHPSS